MSLPFSPHVPVSFLPSFHNVEKIRTETTDHTFPTKSVLPLFRDNLDSIPEDTLDTIHEEDECHSETDSDDTVSDPTEYNDHAMEAWAENDDDTTISSDHTYHEPLVPLFSTYVPIVIDEMTVEAHSFMCACLECYQEDLMNHTEWENIERAEYWADF